MPAKQQIYKTNKTKITKLIHGGQGLGQLENGQKALVWGALPGEEVRFNSTKKRKDFIEGVTSEVILASPDRIVPKDEEYLSTSPWQIMAEEIEDAAKAGILQETFERAGIEYNGEIKSIATERFYGYRNKMEYSFYGDEEGLHLALFNRGTHYKQIVTGSSIAKPEINDAANMIVSVLQENDVRASVLKTLVLRADQQGSVVAALYVKDENFPKLEKLRDVCVGLAVVFSNPKSPASVKTKELYVYGNLTLSEDIAGAEIGYDVYSFFQVNVPVFRQAVGSISRMVGSKQAIDLYSGVGSIGLSIKSVDTLVESDKVNVVWAKKNAAHNASMHIIQAESERALDYIVADKTVIVDPPRAGLHEHVTNKILEVLPEEVVYLSCNPSTQARDIQRLHANYNVKEVECYNFFPRTPHIESLVHLVRR